MFMGIFEKFLFFDCALQIFSYKIMINLRCVTVTINIKYYYKVIITYKVTIIKYSKGDNIND